MKNNKIVFSEVAFDEVNQKIPECGKWLKECSVRKIVLDNDIIGVAKNINSILGIENDQYHKKGVDVNDLLIIATSKVLNVPLFTEERVQQKLPDNIKKCKIPAVCRMPEVNVECNNFTSFVKGSDRIFG
ncbi:MAG: DUF4411 family protein [Candidatus Marinimicrobia bacterium]|nr:DUF4411 family protein [Candidatus Neomarinimicrobiota bacterium]MCH8068724.1 DUF4411 family protein [Candidatus Neomarinimicrobiota bacterium]